jgi:predicted HAD superfamily Cof-like phosphohydrolase
MKAIQSVYDFNKQAGLLDLGYDDFRESAYPIEEALEGFDITYLNNRLHLHEDSSPKNASRSIVTGHCRTVGLSDVDRFDKHIDSIIFSLGSLFKLGLSVDQVLNGLQIVADANLTKLSVGKDSEGKQMKPTDFVGPEEELQKILDERNGSL